jgi:hypothetical protein
MWPVGEVLKRPVRDRLVDYAALQREQRLTFWIDAYNALSLRTVIDHYPVRRDVPERDGARISRRTSRHTGPGPQRHDHSPALRP